MNVDTITIPAGKFVNGEYIGPRILDFSYWRPTISQLDDIGAVAVMRYVAQTTKDSATGKQVSWEIIQRDNLKTTKCLTMPETDYYLSNGIAVLTNHELYATRFNSGYDGGYTDGRFYADVAQEFHMPTAVPLYFSDDTNVTVDTLPVHTSYARGAADGIVEYVYRAAGFYGDNDILSSCYTGGISRDLWYAGARSWSSGLGPIEPCTMQQTVKGSAPGYDMNYVLKPITAWYPHDEQPPQTKGPTMILVQNSEQCPPDAHKLPDYPNTTFPIHGVLWENVNGALRWISPSEFPALANGPNPVPITGYYSNVELQTLPRYQTAQPTDCKLHLPLNVSMQATGLVTE